VANAGRSVSTWISACGARRTEDGGLGRMRLLLVAPRRRVPVAVIYLRCSSLFSSSSQIHRCGRSYPDVAPLADWHSGETTPKRMPPSVQLPINPGTEP
jgi:hypothetical protein